MRTWAAPLALALLACNGSAPLTDVTGARANTEAAGTTYGSPLPGVTADEKAKFDDGLTEFRRDRFAATGLGPVMTGASCLACHDAPPAVGGTNQRLETRFGLRNPDGSFDPLIAQGGPMLQDEAIGTVNGVTWTPEKIPAAANVVAKRRTTPVFGLGLVDATPDATFAAVAAWQKTNHPDQAGRPAKVRDLTRNADAVGRFGWKASEPTLLQFAADAFVNEMGITTPLFPDENCPQGDCSSLAGNPSPGVNDPDGAGLTAAHDFMLFLGPPPRRPGGSTAGAQVFESIGCSVCHLPTLVTGANASAALDRVAYHPFSDFLLHDMGSLGDGIDQADANGAEMRTAPLWGLSFQTRLLHDGRTASIADAILAHDGQGKAARDRFAGLGDSDRTQLLAFLKSL